mmetsp:Transcript_24870/g.53890  ORF Transcript_24870/g.53890 Transcript_24870/m.53890 type:complete len:254 (-) Transcript_24870:244-1005(-)
MIHAGHPSAATMSAMKASAAAAGRQTMSPPEVSAERPANSLKSKISLTLSILLITGSVCSLRVTSALWFLARLSACPKIPKPVTSVAARTPCLCIKPAPVRLSRAMEFMAARYAADTSSGVMTSLALAHNGSFLFIHCMTFTAGCVPRGLVRTMTSPATACSGMISSVSVTTASATPPIIGHGFKTVWPPVTFVPASVQRSLNPFIINSVTMFLSGGVMSVDAAMSINTESQSWTPIAYMSDKTLAHPIRPCK